MDYLSLAKAAVQPAEDDGNELRTNAINAISPHDVAEAAEDASEVATRGVPAVDPDLELEAHVRQAELVVVTYRLRLVRELPLEEAETLFESYQHKLAEWRTFLNQHADADTAELLGSLDDALRQHVGRMRRELHGGRDPPGQEV
jgi:hypothetical protein